MAKILIVCTANICRSPVVEALIRRKLEEVGVDGVEVTSGGFLEDGYEASVGSRRVLASYRGLDLSLHRSHRLRGEDVLSSDLILCMEKRHAEALERFGPGLSSRIFRLAEMAGEPRDVEDPHGGPLVGYERMVREVDGLVERGWDEILRRLGISST